MSAQQIRLHDVVTVDNGSTQFDVIAVGDAGLDVCLREVGSRSASGVWVPIGQVRKVAMRPSDLPHEFVRGDDPNFGSYFGGACVFPLDGVSCGWPEQEHPRGRSVR